MTEPAPLVSLAASDWTSSLQSTAELHVVGGSYGNLWCVRVGQMGLTSTPRWPFFLSCLCTQTSTHTLSLSDTHIFLFLYLWGPRVDSLASIFKAASNILFFSLEVHGSVLHLDLALTLLSARCFGFATYLQYASPSPFSHGPLFSSNTTDKTQFTLPTPGLKQ